MAFVLIAGVSFQSCKKSDENVKKEVDKALVIPGVSTAIQNGVITLSGEVESAEQKTIAENTVKTIKGVKSVVNNITVKEKVITPEPVKDDVIKSAVESKLQTEGFKDVKIEVTNGEIILTGNVKRADLTKVMQIANEANPQKVTNNLNIK